MLPYSYIFIHYIYTYIYILCINVYFFFWEDKLITKLSLQSRCKTSICFSLHILLILSPKNADEGTTTEKPRENDTDELSKSSRQKNARNESQEKWECSFLPPTNQPSTILSCIHTCIYIQVHVLSIMAWHGESLILKSLLVHFSKDAMHWLTICCPLSNYQCLVLVICRGVNFYFIFNFLCYVEIPIKIHKKTNIFQVKWKL